jgi:peptidoglycan/xylan/chitin deacetylase (PgdA/CDA1 family)
MLDEHLVEAHIQETHMPLTKHELPDWLYSFRQTPRYPDRFPDGAHVAVVMHIPFEVWSERPVTVKNPEAYVRHWQSSIPPLPAEAEGKYDTVSILEHDYGGRVGIWRMLDLLDKYDIKGTFLMQGAAADRYPNAVREIFQRGHEVGSRYYYQDVIPPLFSEDEEREHIRETTRALTSFGFDRQTQGPVGFVGSTGRFTQHTDRILVEEGYIWHSSYLNDDRPYCIKVPAGSGHKPLVAIPLSIINAVQDNNVYLGGRSNSPRELFDHFRDEFEVLYEEGKNGKPALINCICHPYIGGRPYVVKWWEEIIKYALGFPKVWITTRLAIARWMLENYPPE